MKIAVCTLFEGNYLAGVGALTNSLWAAGFRGQLYAGYRGAMPAWDTTLLREAGISIEFLKLETPWHLTNFKPDWMLQVLASDRSITHLCYLDPDITVTAAWSYMAEWLQCGVALCEDVNSPLPATHPRRMGWRKHFARGGRPLTCRTETYVNGGFIGLARELSGFLELWRELSIEMGEVIGGLDAAKIRNGKRFTSTGFANCFDSSDQDALNATIEASQYPLSICGKSAMAFTDGEVLMPHALGRDKPWERKFLLMALRGISPRRADKEYFQHVSHPLRLQTAFHVSLKRLEIGLATLVGRIWQK